MLQAMFNGVSGIQAHQERLDVIGNNIANVNTTGYKTGRVTFADQLSQTLEGASAGDGKTLGGTNPQQLGLGVQVGAIDSLMQQGSLQSSSSPTDMAISGNGFFMVGGPTGVEYTRDGSFTVDPAGNLVSTASGQSVLGWQADPATGKVDPNQAITAASKLSIPIGAMTSVKATANASFTGNLSAEALSTDPAYTRSLKVYDSVGAAQTVTFAFQKSAALPAGAPTGATSAWNWAASGSGIAAPTGTANQGAIFFDSSGAEISSTGVVSMTTADGAGTPQTITPSFTGATQVSGSSSAAAATQDGYAPGTLQSFTVDAAGAINGVFSNGQTRTLGQIALADFANPGGLERAGSNNFVATTNTGLAQVGTATGAGLGTITAGALEQSNVDLSSQFTDMIVTQRGFEANTKIVSTVDTLLSDIIAMKTS